MAINQDRGEQKGTVAATGAIVTMVSIVTDGCGWTVRDEKRKLDRGRGETSCRRRCHPPQMGGLY